MSARFRLAPLFVRNPVGFITFVWLKRSSPLAAPLPPRKPACPPRSWAGSRRCLSSRTSPFTSHIPHSEHASPLPCHFCFQITISLINQGKCIISDCLFCQLSPGQQGNASPKPSLGISPWAGGHLPSAGSCSDAGTQNPQLLLPLPVTPTAPVTRRVD